MEGLGVLSFALSGWGHHPVLLVRDVHYKERLPLLFALVVCALISLPTSNYVLTLHACAELNIETSTHIDS